ncbi:RAMP superfamily CRISPR-associated protein [Limnoraphis robusta Tam1]|uniref:RAMP superfamily CRISPR-associated protein n=1 Tax=Limnoraphis robusta TaxID=1118279 RepID=UPI002B1EC013|nr:RAMP superfamily CRISPR-associated protein [Limnoraphis robusta]MEA5539340.1 RAMP superfamily CRISPR-associated protein [Limnoraphis robusta Tam1]
MISLENFSLSIESHTITATLDTALCVGAGGSSGSLADKPILRNTDGNLLIPASQIKGRLRHECEKITRGLGWGVCESPTPNTMCPQREGLSENEEQKFHRDEYQIDDQYHCLICQIFGNPSLPSRVLFDDLICTENPDYLPEILRPGVTINRRRRTAEEQKLYFLETSPVNAKLQFTGQIYFLPNCPNYAKVLIAAGLHHIHALGGSKSAGLGWLTWNLESTLSDINTESSAWEFLAKGVQK